MGMISETGFGWLTPVLSYLMACVGGALGLRATLRAVHAPDRHSRRNWLISAAIAIGTGIWTMHFVAMLGFAVVGTQVRYNVPLTLLSLIVAIVVVGVGVFVVAHGDGKPSALLGGGLATGFGVAAMHYIGMSAVHIDGVIHYADWEVGASVVIATVAATAALWASLTIHNPLASLGASLVMGIAVSAMHYTGMAAVRVLVDPGAPPPSGATAMDFIFPLTVGLGSYLFLTAAYVGLSDTGRSAQLGAPASPDASAAAPAPAAAPAARRPLAEEPTR
ncbi:MHYT domain-containing protein [Actinospica sp.]|uniref:MHYT domain-containing protein n=1 Tax=Actinospica sp. TaxID=1872142 RepID=UPI0032C24222